MLAGSVLPQTVAPVPSAQPVFKAESQLVVLHVSVRDRGGRYVTGLGKDAFTVIDDSQPQTIAMFSGEDVPASVGLVIDNSNSMAPSRERVIAAAVAFAKNSHPQDEVFALTVNEHVREAWAPAIIAETRPEQFAVAMAKAITARGMTALHDGVAEGLRRVQRGIHTRQVLILVSDGGDNASQRSQESILHEARAGDAVIYTVGLIDPLSKDGDPGGSVDCQKKPAASRFSRRLWTRSRRHWSALLAISAAPTRWRIRRPRDSINRPGSVAGQCACMCARRMGGR